MSRITSLDSLLFPVVQERLYSLRADSEDELRAIEHHSAIVRRDSGKVMGVVGRYYQLVTHAEAVEMGRRCVRELLGLEPGAQLEVFQVDAFSDGSLCYVDLVHPSYTMNLLGNVPSEIYLPYVRVTNSYNGLRALSFDVGFCRTLCSNGVVFERETIKFSYVHTRQQLRTDQMEFSIKAGRFAELADKFERFIAGMLHEPANDEDAELAMARVLTIPTRASVVLQSDRFVRARLKALHDHGRSVFERYRSELGANHYAVFNALTELARTLPGRPGMWRDRNALERRVGAWATQFGQRMKTRESERVA